MARATGVAGTVASTDADASQLKALETMQRDHRIAERLARVKAATERQRARSHGSPLRRNAPFLVAIAIMVVIGALEGLSLMVGTGLSHHLDHLFGVHFDGRPAGEGLLGWLHIGRAPILVLLVIFLMAFAISGLILQWAMAGVLGQPLPAWIASIFAAACALPVVRMLGGLISRVIPRDETTAVSEASFVGRLARITGESASEGRPGAGEAHRRARAVALPAGRAGRARTSRSRAASDPGREPRVGHGVPRDTQSAAGPAVADVTTWGARR